MAFARLGAKLSWKVIASFPEVVSEPGGLHANVIGVNSKLACNHQERTNLFRLRQFDLFLKICGCTEAESY